MKKLKITIEGVSYEVEVELLQDDGAPAAPVRKTPARPAASSAPAAAAPAAAATPAASASAGAASPDHLACPLSGVVVTVNAPVGTVVAEGDTVITLEAMKMYTAVCAHKAGTVKEILVNAGQSVDEGQALATIG